MELTVGGVLLVPLPRSPGDEWGTQEALFEEIFLVFLVLGTLVGVVVIGYTLYNAYKYRDRGEEYDEVDRPTLGELPGSEGGGRKLFVSFAISAVIVISLVAWTYGALLYVEAGPEESDDDLNVNVVGFQFGWEFEYPNGHTETNELRVPADQVVTLTVTSDDVWHSFGIPDLRVKADAIPGQTTETWFIAEETGEYEAWCFELCGIGHSQMRADVIVMEPTAFEEWYENPDAYDDESTEDEEETGEVDGTNETEEAGNETEADGDNGANGDEAGNETGDENSEEDETNAVSLR